MLQMFWKRCIFILLSFASCTDTQSTSIPRISNYKFLASGTDIFTNEHNIPSGLPLTGGPVNRVPIFRAEADGYAKAETLGDANCNGSRNCSLDEQILNEAYFKLPELVLKLFKYLSFTDMLRAKNVCKIWRELANEKIQSFKIVHLHSSGRLTATDREVLQKYLKERTHRWRPALLLLFDDLASEREANDEWIDNTNNFLKSKYIISDCVGYSIMEMSAAERSNILANHFPDVYSRSGGYILPEALLEKVDINVMYMSLENFVIGRIMLLWEIEGNRKPFADYFGWKVQAPIKLALIFIRTKVYNPGLSQRSLDNRAIEPQYKLIDWLELLPEGEEVPTSHLPDTLLYRRPGNDGKDVAVLLFGGDNLFVTSKLLETKFNPDEDMPTSFSLLDHKAELEAWKTRVIDRWPESGQKIAFFIGDKHVKLAKELFGSVFGDDIPLIVLHSAAGVVFNYTFIVIGFPML